MIKPALRCVACSASARIGSKDRRVNVMGLSPLLYRRGSGKGLVRTGRRVSVCDACLVAFIAGTIDSRFMKVVTALRESLSGLYSGVIEDQSE